MGEVILDAIDLLTPLRGEGKTCTQIIKGKVDFPIDLKICMHVDL